MRLETRNIREYFLVGGGNLVEKVNEECMKIITVYKKNILKN